MGIDWYAQRTPSVQHLRSQGDRGNEGRGKRVVMQSTPGKAGGYGRLALGVLAGDNRVEKPLNLEAAMSRLQIRCTTIALLALVLGCVQIGQGAPPAPYPWKAGVAAGKITPKKPMWMAGYAARKKPSEGVTQELFAKALALEDKDGGRVVIVTMDLIGVIPTLREAVEQQVREKHKLPPEALLMAASHTHCGPEYRHAKGAKDDKAEYFGFLADTVVRLVGESLKNLAPAQLTYGHARAGFAMNRRRNYQLPKGDINENKAPNPDGPVDHDVPVLLVSNPDDTPRAVVFGYACHSTTLGFYQFCGDYAGYAQEYLEKAHPGMAAMFLIGCGADQNPYPRSTLELAQQHGRSLATAVEAALYAHPRPLRGPVRCALERIPLKKPTAPEPLSYPVQVIRFSSDITLVALASEVVVDYSLRLKRQLAAPPGMVWVSGYSNGYFGYIPSDRVLQEGGYEAASWKTGIEEPIVSKVMELYKRLGAAPGQ